MQKLYIAASLIALSATGALAQSAKIPTGIDVRGSTYYVIPAGTTTVVQIAEACTPRAAATRTCPNGTLGERPTVEAGASSGGSLGK